MNDGRYFSFLNTLGGRARFTLLPAVLLSLASAIAADTLPRSGDVRDGYESADYVSRSQNLQVRWVINRPAYLRGGWCDNSL